MADHRVERAKERYGVDLTASDIAAMERGLTKASCIKAHGLEVVHVVRHSGVAMLAAVKTVSGRQIISTFLPPDAFASQRRREWRRKRRAIA